ncbi:MAG: sodium:solute symporter family protein, partial [Planctomycetales bacterium]|nr:sodium:solute symporter family protein [Planctomycetales bacterium]
GLFAASGHGVPKPLASATICGVVLVYVFFGGMRGTAWANTFQTLVFMVLGVVTFVTIANALGGGDSLLENMRRASQAVPEPQLSRAKIPNSVFFSFLLIPLSVGMFPHVFQHWLTARSAAAFKLPIVLHPIFIMIVWLPCVLIGVWASAPSAGFEPGFNENEVLATLVKQHAGPVLGGLLTAGILAAIMSSLDSQFLCVGTIFTEDIVLHYSRKGRFSERQTVVIARLFVVLIVAITYVCSLFPRAVFDLGLWSFTGFCGLFPLVIAALYWRRLTSAGAIASVLAMTATWVALFRAAEWGHNPRFAFPTKPIMAGDMTLLPPLHPVVTVMIVATVVLVAVSLVTRPPAEAAVRRFFP